MSSPTPSTSSTAAAVAACNDDDDDDRRRTSRKHTPDYADECLHLDEPPEPWTEPVSSLALRKGSCETQWDVIKKRFLNWQENSQKKCVIFLESHQ